MYYAVALLVILLVFPYLKIFAKRLYLLSSVKKICKKSNLKYVPVRFFRLFGGIKNGKCDFYIVGDNMLFRVKLACSVSKRLYFSFNDENSYYLKSLRWTFAATRFYKTFKLKKKRPFDFDFGMRDEWRGYKTKDILLFCPVPGGVYIQENGAQKEIWNGDFTGEAFFYNTTGFVDLLKNITYDNEKN